jgi:NADPH-dependent 2,4-dienoyl-CoA reductase/sulfur reductase-like enzyme
MTCVDVAVVGAGPAGLAAAAAAAGEGARVVVFDDQDTPGGQYLRQPHRQLGTRGRDPFVVSPGLARRLGEVLAHRHVEYRPSTTVWNLPEAGVLAWADGHASGRLAAAATVLAAGAHDRCVPFPGWTLPGVVTAGGVQNLLKGQRVLPGRRVVVAGNGPLLLVVAASLLRAGAEVAAVAELAPVGLRVVASLPGLAASPALLAQAARYRLRLLTAGVPVLRGHTLIEARGEATVREAVLAPVDVQGEADPARARRFDVDAVVTGFGLQCSSELPRLAGCELVYRPLRGGWLPLRDPWLESSLPGLFVAGDGAAIGGAAMAVEEGTLAGLGAVRRARGECSTAGAARARALRRRLARLARFRDALEALFAPPARLSALRRPDTVVCRCEDVTDAEIAAALEAGATSLAGIKSRTRAGMGRCQGRNCLHTLAEALAQRAGCAPAALHWPRARPPARPVSIAALLTEPLAPPRLPEDPHLPRV